MYFAKFSAIILSAIAFSSSAFGSPIELTDLDTRGSFSLDRWGGHDSLRGFDNFYGSDNYDGHRYDQHFGSRDVLVCRTVQIEIIQQRLLILREMAKQVITEQICEVETQTIALHQHLSNINSFYDDLHRRSGRRVGYDRHIAGRFGDIFDQDGSVTSNDLGFSGRDQGRDYVEVTGSNWDDERSPGSVNQAIIAARSARDAARSSQARD